MSDYNLDRFTAAHQWSYATALQEIRNGRKRTHWMWYIFPQVQGLGYSPTAQTYAIDSLEEAVAFLADPYLGKHLREICGVLLELETSNAVAVFGRIDAMKLKSSMTLFSYVAEEDSVFTQVLDKFYNGQYDIETKKILNID